MLGSRLVGVDLVGQAAGNANAALVWVSRIGVLVPDHVLARHKERCAAKWLHAEKVACRRWYIGHPARRNRPAHRRNTHPVAIQDREALAYQLDIGLLKHPALHAVEAGDPAVDQPLGDMARRRQLFSGRRPYLGLPFDRRHARCDLAHHRLQDRRLRIDLEQLPRAAPRRRPLDAGHHMRGVLDRGLAVQLLGGHAQIKNCHHQKA